MGNLETLCQNVPHSTQNIGEDATIMKLIIENRKQLTEFPSAPLHIQQQILKLLKANDFAELYHQSKIWKVKHPYRFCYINQPQNKDKGPMGKCSLYLYQQKGEFVGFYRGNIDDKGVRDVKGCLYVFANGDYFIGDAEKQNYGMYIDRENKYQYEGDWVSGKPHGEGKQQTSRGVYEGYFKNGKKNGRGRFTFAGEKQIVYEGDFFDNEITGSGKIMCQRSNYEYSGQFLGGEKHGMGVEKSGQVLYDGHFECNKKCGQGRLVSSEYEYEGEFLNGKANGRGVMIKKGEKIQGIWEEGQLQAFLNTAQ